MQRQIMTRICLWVVLALLPGCNQLSPDTYWHSGHYILVAVDTPGQMTLTTDDQGGMSVALVGPTVFSIGADDKHVVAKQHPSKDASGEFDRSATHYFIVDRGGDGKTVNGPLSEAEFLKLSASHTLPAFTKTFSELE